MWSGSVIISPLFYVEQSVAWDIMCEGRANKCEFMKTVLINKTIIKLF